MRHKQSCCYVCLLQLSCDVHSACSILRNYLIIGFKMTEICVENETFKVEV